MNLPSHHTRGKIMENKVRFKLHKVKKHWITI
ncbi:MAG: KxYKxGKxW signal peptide domain-containing protein, partial [Streptococcus salivarius]|nr:KxYKxGKxW signal peptide domain-containing protein [Streptococcus salivarius]